MSVPRPRARLSYILRETAEETQHRFGVNALRLSADGTSLYSGGRDGIVRHWDTQTAPPAHLGNFDLHTDWVNDVALCEDVDFLISASSDSSLKVWKLSTKSQVAALNKHEDYVKAVSYSPATKKFASVGLDSKLVIWDMSSMREVTSEVNDKHPKSLYSVAYHHDGKLIATGSSDKIIRLWDPRDPHNRVGELQGHDDVVKCLAMSHDGTKLLSGCSDCSVKLWDVGEQRCIATYGCHADSIWSLRVDAAFTHAYTGGRDGAVFATRLKIAPDSPDASHLLIQVNDPVLDLEITPDQSHMWVSTTSSDIALYPIPELPAVADVASVSEDATSAAGEEGMFDENNSHTSDEKRSRTSTDSPLAVTALVRTPIHVIAGAPGIVAFQLLPDRMHVISKGSDGRVCKWSVLQGVKVQTFPENTDYESVVEVLVRDGNPRPKWCDVDAQTGSLAVHTTESMAFSAWSLVDPTSLEDARFNLGGSLIQALLREFQESVRSAEAMASFERQGVHAPVTGLKEELQREAIAKGISHTLFDVPRHLLLFVTDVSEAPCVVCACRVNEAGSRGFFKQLKMLLPLWVTQCLFDITKPFGNSSAPQIQFHLRPHMSDTNELPALKTNFLSCMGCMPVWRLARHVINTIPHVEDMVRAVLPRSSAGGQDVEIDFQASQHIEILCCDEPMDPMAELQYVKSRMSRRGEDFVLTYRWRDGIPPSRRSSNDAV